MALTKKETAIVAALTTAGFAYGESVWNACKLSIMKAYRQNDSGEFAQAVVDAVLVKDKKAVAAYFRRAMLNVLIDGKSISVGAPVDAKYQSKAFAFMAANVPLAMVDAHVKAKSDKPKELKGFAKDRASKALGSLITRLKESDPDAALLLNEMAQLAEVKSTLQPIADCKPTADEVRLLTEFLQTIRMTDFDVKADEVEFAIAA